ncbi:RNA polymerase sigma-70 factor (ECF subfamily) [Paenibacillus sp. DS2015]|uniref:RNA polymerase sigma factor n=1 Tax=Paenibacillus sp. DS2015 TaxID=3373917 RepID=UPI003D1BFA7C
MENEQKWIRRIKTKSDRTAANELVLKYYKEIYAFVYKQILNKETAMDLTQEIFTSMLQTISSFDERKASFRTWLYKISTYRIVDYYRSKYYKTTRMMDPIEENDFSDHSDFTIRLEYREDVEKVMEIINTLDVRTQHICRFKLFAENTFSEIAVQLELPESTIKTNYYTAIRKINRLFMEVENG